MQGFLAYMLCYLNCGTAVRITPCNETDVPALSLIHIYLTRERIFRQRRWQSVRHHNNCRDSAHRHHQNLMNEAAIRAAGENREYITQDDICLLYTSTDSKSSDSSGYSLINKDISDYLSTLTSLLSSK